jgi:hypothetical protein
VGFGVGRLGSKELILSAQGSTPSLFVGTTAFEVIVKQQIKRLEDPSLKCCQLVYDELIRILGQLLSKIVSAFFLIHLEEILVDAFHVVYSKHSDGSRLCESDSMLSSSVSSNKLWHPQRSSLAIWSREQRNLCFGM